MRYISVFSGIEAATAGWHHMGWKPVVFADIDEFPSAVLKYHYPEVKNVGDVLNVDWNEYKGKADLIVGGSPCQSFSHAGKRLGMDDPRGNLALHYLRIVRGVQPKWFIYENVPGLLSSNEGEDFATFLREVAELGYGFAYRIFDAQYFGVPQRRRRVFVVGCADGDWRSAAAILFDKASLCGDSAKGRSTTKGATLFSQGSIGSKGRESSRRGIIHCNDVAPTICAANPPSRTGARGEDDEAVVVHKSEPLRKGIIHCNDVGPTMTSSGPPYARTGNERVEHEALVVQNAIPIHDKATRYKGGGDGRNDDGASNFLGVGAESDPMYSLTANDKHMIFQTDVAGLVSKGNGDIWEIPERHMSLTTGGGQAGQGYPAVRQDALVRRLTPLECERLQGFPDNYTRITWKGKSEEECPDGHRYKALGNSMAVPVMRWIGERIELLDSADLTNRASAKTTQQMTLW